MSEEARSDCDVGLPVRIREPEAATSSRRFRAAGIYRQDGGLGKHWFNRSAFLRRKNRGSRIRHSKSRQHHGLALKRFAPLMQWGVD
jgi:hypothetical protein